MTTRFVLTRFSAFLPIAMSMAALGVVGLALVVGTPRQPDEGAFAHICQILVAGQVPLVAYFAIRWLPAAPRPALTVLAIQVAAGLAALAPVFLLQL